MRYTCLGVCTMIDPGRDSENQDSRVNCQAQFTRPQAGARACRRAFPTMEEGHQHCEDAFPDVQGD